MMMSSKEEDIRGVERTFGHTLSGTLSDGSVLQELLSAVRTFLRKTHRFFHNRKLVSNTILLRILQSLLFLLIR